MNLFTIKFWIVLEILCCLEIELLGHVITSQGGHALTNKLLIKFFSDKSNWSLKGSKSINKKAQIEETLKKPLTASI